MWCPVVAPRILPQPPCSSLEATQSAASEPGRSTPPPAKRSKCTKAEQAADPTQPAKDKDKARGKAVEAKPTPHWKRLLIDDASPPSPDPPTSTAGAQLEPNFARTAYIPSSPGVGPSKCNRQYLDGHCCAEQSSKTGGEFPVLMPRTQSSALPDASKYEPGTNRAASGMPRQASVPGPLPGSSSGWSSACDAQGAQQHPPEDVPPSNMITEALSSLLTDLAAEEAGAQQHLQAATTRLSLVESLLTALAPDLSAASSAPCAMASMTQRLQAEQQRVSAAVAQIQERLEVLHFARTQWRRMLEMMAGVVVEPGSALSLQTHIFQDTMVRIHAFQQARQAAKATQAARGSSSQPHGAAPPYESDHHISSGKGDSSSSEGSSSRSSSTGAGAQAGASRARQQWDEGEGLAAELGTRRSHRSREGLGGAADPPSASRPLAAVPLRDNWSLSQHHTQHTPQNVVPHQQHNQRQQQQQQQQQWQQRKQQQQAQGEHRGSDVGAVSSSAPHEPDTPSPCAPRMAALATPLTPGSSATTPHRPPQPHASSRTGQGSRAGQGLGLSRAAQPPTAERLVPGLGVAGGQVSGCAPGCAPQEQLGLQAARAGPRQGKQPSHPAGFLVHPSPQPNHVLAIGGVEGGGGARVAADAAGFVAGAVDRGVPVNACFNLARSALGASPDSSAQDPPSTPAGVDTPALGSNTSHPRRRAARVGRGGSKLSSQAEHLAYLAGVQVMHGSSQLRSRRRGQARARGCGAQAGVAGAGGVTSVAIAAPAWGSAVGSRGIEAAAAGLLAIGGCWTASEPEDGSGRDGIGSGSPPSGSCCEGYGSIDE
ncbi:hypothetical protein QJQ45_026254 [Haematococcus lacustris]|nr:hypothetical protein QJQ45_026254 [Haematococcus lacustris]